MERHVAVDGSVVQTATLEVRQVLEGWGAYGRAGSLQGQQDGSRARGQTVRGGGQKVIRWVALIGGRQLRAHQTGSMCQGHGHGRYSGMVQLIPVFLFHHH